MKIEGNHWTVRWYKHFVSLGGFGRDPENLCRFLRVIVLWAPLRWTYAPTKDGKDRFPPILAFIFGLGCIAMVVGLIGGIAIEANRKYVEKGWAGFAPDPTVQYWGLVAFVSLVALIVTSVITSGLFSLYRAKFAAAKNAGYCPFIETAPLLPVPLVMDVVSQETEGFEDDELLTVAREVEQYLSQKFQESDQEPKVLFALREAIRNEDE